MVFPKARLYQEQRQNKIPTSENTCPIPKDLLHPIGAQLLVVSVLYVCYPDPTPFLTKQRGYTSQSRQRLS